MAEGDQHCRNCQSHPKRDFARNQKNEGGSLRNKGFQTRWLHLDCLSSENHKNVLLLSTMHAIVDTGDDRKSKPEILKFYNSTKFGAIVLRPNRQKVHCTCSFSQVACAIFLHILDLAAINAHILYKLVTGSKISPRRYLLRLSEEHRSRFVEERKANSHQYSQTNSSMQKSQKRKHCQSKSCTKKTRETCSCCSKLVCGKRIGKQETLIYCRLCCQKLLVMMCFLVFL